MTQTGKVHFLTRIPGRKEVHLLGNADLIASFKLLQQQLGSFWGIEDMSNCVLEYSGPLLKCPNGAIVIGTDEEWTFARERFCDHVDSPTPSTAVAIKKPTSGYDASSGYCYSCQSQRGSGYSRCNYCTAAVVAVPEVAPPVKPYDPISILIRRKSPTPVVAELEALSDDEKAAKFNALTKERDASLLAVKKVQAELDGQRAAFDAQTAELDKSKAAHKKQSDVLTALAAAYLRETGKAFTLEGINEQFKAGEQGAAGNAPSASSVGGFDVVDDGESVD